MLAHLRPATGVTVIFFVLLGLLYPLAETGIGQALFSHQANGSLVADGSTLVGQSWTSPRWFVGRPDADNPMATGGTNLGPRSRPWSRPPSSRSPRCGGKASRQRRPGHHLGQRCRPRHRPR